MSEHRATYRAAIHFPAALYEAWPVRDGRGRVVETWTVHRITEGRTDKHLIIGIEGYRPTEEL